MRLDGGKATNGETSELWRWKRCDVLRCWDKGQQQLKRARHHSAKHLTTRHTGTRWMALRVCKGRSLRQVLFHHQKAAVWIPVRSCPSIRRRQSRQSLSQSRPKVISHHGRVAALPHPFEPLCWPGDLLHARCDASHIIHRLNDELKAHLRYPRLVRRVLLLSPLNFWTVQFNKYPQSSSTPLLT